MKIGNREIGCPAYIIAEAGTAHAGNIKTAMQFVDVAKNAGADAIKFQIFTPREELFCPMEGDDDRWAWWNQSMMTLGEWRNVKQLAQNLNIHFFASVFQHTGIEWGKELEFPVWKVASRAALRFPYGDLPGPFLVSCGFSIPIDVRVEGDNRERMRLKCQAIYPCPLLLARWEFLDHGMEHAGLSDHSGTIYPALDAMARGAQIIEVHIKLNDAGPDAASSIAPYNLRQICEARDAFALMRQS